MENKEKEGRNISFFHAYNGSITTEPQREKFMIYYCIQNLFFPPHKAIFTKLIVLHTILLKKDLDF